MATFYRGAGLDTYWHSRDARVQGFQAWAPTKEPSIPGVMHHVVRGTTVSPYVSLTRSYGIAFGYATMRGRRRPSKERPAFVYELEIEEGQRQVRLVDPVVEIAASVPRPVERSSYQHDGAQNFLLGVVDPKKFAKVLQKTYRQPPPQGGTPRPPLLTVELEAMVRALRDAEILAVSYIPRFCVRERYEVW
ncbi:MAG: hypothetical protein HY820_33520 [Acidobacteria bacterium]|nr:hypothetical protein [Acidobacteriota bacterium]